MNIKLKKVLARFILYISGYEAYARYIGVKIGKRCRIYSSSFGSEPFLITIGDGVIITGGVSFITHDGSTSLFKDESGRRYLYQPINIGNDVFIGFNSIILPGVKIEDKVIIAAGSVVSKSIPSGSIVGGVPARIIGSYNDFENKVLVDYISEQQIDKTLDYQARVEKITNYTYKPYLKL